MKNPENPQISHFLPKCVWAYVLPGPDGTFSSKTLHNAKVPPWEHFFDQNDPSAFETVIYQVRWMIFRSQNALGAQNAFWSYFSTFGPKCRAPGRGYIRVNEGSPRLANF